MEGTVFKKTERMLYNYYRKKEGLLRNKKALETTEKHIQDIRLILMDADELIPSFGVIGNYMCMVGGTGKGITGDPTVRRFDEHHKSIEDLQDELARLIRRKIKLKMRIMKLEAEMDGIEFALGLLDEEERNIAEQKYLYKRSNIQVGIALGMDESTVRYRRNAFVQKVAKSLRIQK